MRVLIVTQEMEPYTELNDIANIARKLPQHIQEKGMEIRVLMPRYGTINERRHRLHEVVRLSGMNIIVDDDDYPLIIKVASLPRARIQVYFLDNDEFFKRKTIFADKDGNVHDDNAERSIFFCKGVIETVKKFGWPPHIIHCHGWMTALLPLYVKQAYATEPLFRTSKVIYSLYHSDIKNNFDEDFAEKAAINDLEEDDLNVYLAGDEVNLHQGACTVSDAIIIGSESLDPDVEALVNALDKPVLPYQPEENFLGAYVDFYHQLTQEEEVEEAE